MTVALDPTAKRISRSGALAWSLADIGKLFVALAMTQAMFWIVVLGVVQLSPLNPEKLEPLRVLNLEAAGAQSLDNPVPVTAFKLSDPKEVLMPNPGLVRFKLVVKDPAEGIGIFIPRLADNAVLFVNGERLAPPKGTWGTKPARTGVVGMFFEVPATNLTAGDNRFELLVVRTCCRAFVNAIYAGPLPQMWPVGAAARWFRVDLAWIIIATSLLIGLVASSLLPFRRNLPFLVSVLACSATVALGTYFYLDTGTLISTIWRAWYGHILGALVGYLSFMCLVNAWTNGPPWLYRVSLIVGSFCVIVSAALVPFQGHAEVLFTARIMLAIVMIGAIGAVCYLLWAYIQTKETGRYWQAGLLLISSVAAVVDYLFALDYKVQPIYFVPFSNLTLMAALGIALAQRGAQMYLEAEAANLTLEARIAIKEQELVKAAIDLRDQEAQTATQTERARIMRDMHDGMGGQLLSLLMQTRDPDTPREDLEQAVEAAIGDLRLLVDSLDSVGDSLDVALAVFRDRLIPRMRSSGVKFGWHNELTQPTAGHSPSVTLNVYRILQEAMSNALKYAKAKEIAIKIAPSETVGSIDISVQDDGHGISNDAIMGRGIANMRRRASDIDGKLTIESNASGTTVRLTLPA